MNLVQSIFKYKCPRCRKGNLFHPMKSLGDILEMPKECIVCGQATEPEPGFYYGAMFLSYIGTGFTYLALVAVLIIGFKLPLNYTFGILILFAMLCYIPTIRLARSLWIHMNVKYDKKYN